MTAWVRIHAAEWRSWAYPRLSQASGVWRVSPRPAQTVESSHAGLAGWHMSNRLKVECQASEKHFHGSVPVSLVTGHGHPGHCLPAGQHG